MNGAFSDLWSLYLAMIGCLVSVFTLLYSFLISKKGDLKLFAEQISKGDKSPTIQQRQRFATSYIRRIEKAANLCLILLGYCIVLTIVCWIGARILVGKPQQVAFVVIASLTILLFVSLVILSVKIIRQYKKDAKI